MLDPAAKRTVFNPLIAAPVTGNVPIVLFILYPFPDLSLHSITLDPERVSVVVSAASSHNWHPGIVGAPRSEFKIEPICPPGGKKIEGWLVSVFEMAGMDEDVGENKSGVVGREYESGICHFLER